MTTDTMYFRSRRPDHKAYLHVYGNSYKALSNDEELNLFGGTVYFHQGKIVTITRATEAPDLHEFHNTIARQCKYMPGSMDIPMS